VDGSMRQYCSSGSDVSTAVRSSEQRHKSTILLCKSEGSRPDHSSAVLFYGSQIYYSNTAEEEIKRRSAASDL
jgi:hypothetical protein